MLSWSDLSKVHFRLSVAEKYNISLFASKKRGRTSNADLEKAKQVERATAEAIAAAAELLAQKGLSTDNHSTQSSNLLPSSDVVGRPSDFQSTAPLQATKPFEIVENPAISTTDIVVALSNLAEPKSGGPFSKNLGKSLQLYKYFKTDA